MEWVFYAAWVLGFGFWAYSIAEEIGKPSPVLWFFLGGLFSWITMLILYSQRRELLNNNAAKQYIDAVERGENVEDFKPKFNTAALIIAGIAVVFVVGKIVSVIWY